MSFGFSSSDLVMLLKGLGKLASILRHESVDEFRQCSRSYKAFIIAVRRIDRFINANGLHEDPVFRKTQRDIEKMLRKYFGKIKTFRPHLGPDRVKRSLRGAIAKLNWRPHHEVLRKLRQEIDLQLNVINILLRTNEGPGAGIVPAVGPPQLPVQRHRKYYAVLVTTPPVHTYGPVSDRLCATRDAPPRIAWASTATTGIPSLVASLAFRRHFAFCLVTKESWESTTKTLAEKFQGQLFWDYYGDSTICSRAASWSPHNITKINAIQVLGIVAPDGDAAQLCTDRYLQIRKTWDYLHIWWNDADFALVLACLLVDDTAAATCRSILHHLTRLRETDVTGPREGMVATNVVAGAAGFAGGVILTAITGGLAGAVFAIGSWGWGAGSIVTGAALQGAEDSRGGRRLAAARKLQQRFPGLRRLFG